MHLQLRALPLQIQKPCITTLQRTRQLPAVLFDCPFSLQKIFLIQSCRKHFPSTVDQIVCLIHKEQILAPSLGKKALQLRTRIKNIIVIADHCIAP